jgi:transposase
MIPNLIGAGSKKRIQPKLARRGTPHGSGLGRQRFVVERTLSWFHQFRKLEMHEERNAATYEALSRFARALIALKRTNG